MKVWILTEEYNDYDQHGEYFVAAFKNKPTSEQISKVCKYLEQGVEHVLSGGGRIEYEYHWYWLREEELQ